MCMPRVDLKPQEDGVLRARRQRIEADQSDVFHAEEMMDCLNLLNEEVPPTASLRHTINWLLDHTDHGAAV